MQFMSMHSHCFHSRSQVSCMQANGLLNQSGKLLKMHDNGLPTAILHEQQSRLSSGDWTRCRTLILVTAVRNERRYLSIDLERTPEL